FGRHCAAHNRAPSLSVWLGAESHSRPIACFPGRKVRRAIQRTHLTTALLSTVFALLCTAASALPFDFVVGGLDVNGWPLNPRWGAQVAQPATFPDPLACPGLEPW